MDDPAILLEGSRIAWVGPAAEAPEPDEEMAGDWFLMPGAADHHVHIGLSDARAVLRGGVTFARDLAWSPDAIFPLADISQSTDFDGPTIVAAGPMLTVPGGYPSRAGWCPAGGWIEVRGAEEAAAAVERVAAQDPACIKLALNADDGPTLDDAELLAIVGAAHGRGLTVAAHVQGGGQTERALGAGVDELAHTPWTERLPGALIQTLARSTTICSTLDIHSYGRPSPSLEVALDNLARFVAAGGRVRYGTDLGNGPIPPGIHVGEVFHLRQAGLAPDAILTAMTASRLEPQQPADIVGLASNPLEDLGALGRVDLVVRSGRVCRP